jgi:hypothetical protein
MTMYFYLLAFGIIQKANKNDEKLKTNNPLVWPTKTREGFFGGRKKFKTTENYSALFSAVFP